MSAIVSHKFKFIFPHIPRTGGTSLTEFIMPQLGRKDRTDSTLEKHQALRTLKLGFDEFDDYVKFAVARHPFDRIASLHQGYEPKCTLEHLIAQIAAKKIDIKAYAFFWPMKRWLCNAKGENLADYIFKFESGFKPVVKFLNHMGMDLDIKDFPHVNAGNLKSKKREKYEAVWDGLSVQAQDTFRQLYKWDYEAFGYK